MSTQSSGHRLALITAGHHFLLNVLPLRAPQSRVALQQFLAALEWADVSLADVDGVLLRCLVTLDTRTGRRIPSLVDRYLSCAHSPAASLAAFTACLDDLLCYHEISDGAVQLAVEVIRLRFADASLTPRTIADAISRRLSSLDVSFRREMGCTLTEHLRNTRLDHAARLLASTGRSVKEIWADAGYNHASNFAHDFKRRFGSTPRAFRARSIRPVAQALYAPKIVVETAVSARTSRLGGAHVLVVDNDERTTSTLATHLVHLGVRVTTAASGEAGLRETNRVMPTTILVDYRLEDMTGLAFLRALRERFPGETPAAALFTADWDVFDFVDELRALHAVAVSKLCDLEQVTWLITYLSADTHMAAEQRSFT
jgi:AraC-like DNA-binding protein/CheY-like chemotaxis protein